MVNTGCWMSKQQKTKKQQQKIKHESDLSGDSGHVVVTGTGGRYLNPLKELETTTTKLFLPRLRTSSCTESNDATCRPCYCQSWILWSFIEQSASLKVIKRGKTDQFKGSLNHIITTF